MSDQRRPLETEDVDQANGIGGEVRQAVCVDVFRLRRLAITPLVIGDCPKSGPGESWDLVPPGVGELRKTVDHDHRVASAFIDGCELHPVDGVEGSVHTLSVVRRTGSERRAKRCSSRTQGCRRSIWRLRPAVRVDGTAPGFRGPTTPNRTTRTLGTRSALPRAHHAK